MKGKLEFDLDDPSDRLAHKRASNATNAYIAFHEIDNMLREYVKYNKNINPGDKIALYDGYHEITEKESIILNEFAQIIRSKICSITTENDINMDDLE